MRSPGSPLKEVVYRLFTKLPCWLKLSILLPYRGSEEMIVRRGWLTFNYSVYEQYLLYRMCEHYYLACWLRKRWFGHDRG
jgi:hypothetical protein